MTQQRLVPVKAYDDGTFKLLDETDGRHIKDLLADGWLIREMVAPGPEGLVLLLLERENPRGHAQGGQGARPF